MILVINPQEKSLEAGKDPEKETQTTDQETTTDAYYDECSLNVHMLSSISQPSLQVVWSHRTSIGQLIVSRSDMYHFRAEAFIGLDASFPLILPALAFLEAHVPLRWRWVSCLASDSMRGRNTPL